MDRARPVYVRGFNPPYKVVKNHPEYSDSIWIVPWNLPWASARLVREDQLTNELRHERSSMDAIQMAAARGLRAFQAIEHDDNDKITCIYDLVTDLLHFADQVEDEEYGGHKSAGEYVLHMAEFHYRAERNRDDD